MSDVIDCLLIGYAWESEISPFLMESGHQVSGFNFDFNFNKEFNAAIAYLGTYLHRRGFTFDYINSAADEQELLIRKLTSHNILSVGISTTFCLDINQVIKTIKLIRKYNSSVKIIVGGAFIVLYTRELAESGEKMLQFILGKVRADFIIDSFQGEDALVGILNTLKVSGYLPDEVPNIYYKSGNDYFYTWNSTENIRLGENMVDWTLFKDRAEKIVPVRTSVSCPFSCSFCTYPLNNGKYRYVDAEAVERELDSIQRIGKVEYVHFVDDALNIPKERFVDILKMMIKNKYTFKWYSYIRCQHLDRETAGLIKMSNCEGVLLGIESANNHMLRRMNKQIDVDIYRKTIAILHEHKIPSYALFFFGFPGETADSINDTINFIEEVKPTFYFIGVWHNDPRTPINNEAEEYHIEGTNRSWSHKTMDYATAEKFRNEALLKIKNSIPLSFYYSDIFQMLRAGYSYEKINDICRARIWL